MRTGAAKFIGGCNAMFAVTSSLRSLSKPTLFQHSPTYSDLASHKVVWPCSNLPTVYMATEAGRTRHTQVFRNAPLARTGRRRRFCCIYNGVATRALTWLVSCACVCVCARQRGKGGLCLAPYRVWSAMRNSAPMIARGAFIEDGLDATSPFM